MKRFTNNSQLVRYLSTTTELSEDEIWNRLENESKRYK